MNFLNFKKTNLKCILKAIAVLFIFLGPYFSFSQESKVTAEVDTAQIKIGEQIIYNLTVETKPENLVVFPENGSFSPMEVVEALKTDTTRTVDKFRLLKKYALTKFDSGHYVIPRQRVVINGKNFLSDSIAIEVADVAVDTTKQKLYPIKPSMEIPGSNRIPVWVWWILGILILIGVVSYLFFRRKKRIEEAEAKLPPYEQALVELEQLDRSALLEKRELKAYYSQLAAVVRKYLDEKVYDHALESTTGELIAFLEMKKNAGTLLIDDKTISELKIILQRADLAKFANSKPDVLTAKADRSSAESIINSTRSAVPEPTEEELLKDQKYQEELKKNRKRRRIAFGVIGGIIVLLIAISAIILNYGVTNVRDSLFGNDTREMLEGDWISSSYGTPAVTVTTPEVLVREEIDAENEPPNPANFKAESTESFSFGDINKTLHIRLATMVFGRDIPFNLEKTVENVASELEEKGAKNILVKDEIFKTIDGTDGLKISGSFTMEDQETGQSINKKYVKLHFVRDGGFQSLFISYNQNDEHAEEISKRVVNSVQFKGVEE